MSLALAKAFDQCGVTCDADETNKLSSLAMILLAVIFIIMLSYEHFKRRMDNMQRILIDAGEFQRELLSCVHAIEYRLASIEKLISASVTKADSVSVAREVIRAKRMRLLPAEYRVIDMTADTIDSGDI